MTKQHNSRFSIVPLLSVTKTLQLFHLGLILPFKLFFFNCQVLTDSKEGFCRVSLSSWYHPHRGKTFFPYNQSNPCFSSCLFFLMLPPHSNVRSLAPCSWPALGKHCKGCCQVPLSHLSRSLTILVALLQTCSSLLLSVLNLGVG